MVTEKNPTTAAAADTEMPFGTFKQTINVKITSKSRAIAKKMAKKLSWIRLYFVAPPRTLSNWRYINGRIHSRSDYQSSTVRGYDLCMSTL